MSAGESGNSVQNYSSDLTVLVGMSSPNTFPSTKVDSFALTKPNVSVCSGGVFVRQQFVKYTKAVDTSWLCPSGVYTLGVGNKMNVVCGSGGIYYSTTGSIFLHGDGIDCFTSRFSVLAETCNLGTVDTFIRGKSLTVESKETSFANQVTFLNNVVIKGGLYVAGETYNTHSTTCGQKALTSASASLNANINFIQSFMVYNGCSAVAKTAVQTKWKSVDGMPNKFGYIDAVIALQLPGANEIYEAPCQIAFPKGISICSDSGIKDVNVDDIIQVVLNPARVPTPDLPDVAAPGHFHQYIGSGGNASDSNSLASEASQCATNNLATAKPVTFNNMNVKNLPAEYLELYRPPLVNYGKEKLGWLASAISGGTGTA